MHIRFASFVVWLGLAACASSPETAAPPEPAVVPATALLPFDAPESRERLARSRAADFYALASQFEPQHHLGNCGPASAVAVLNVLFAGADPKSKPLDDSLVPDAIRGKAPPNIQLVAPRYTQRAFFDERFAAVKPIARFYGQPDAEGKRDPGLQLRQLAGILEKYGLSVDVRVVSDDLAGDQVRQEIAADVADASGFVIANYFRPALGQDGGGHISPVAAYDEASESFLVMDVNPARAPWTWVPAEMLIKAMRTADILENRGYLRIRVAAP